MNRHISLMNRHPSLSQCLSRSEVLRLTVLCLIFVAANQLYDPLLDATLWQESSYWLARVGAFVFGIFVAAILVGWLPSRRWSRPAWIRPILFVTLIGILPLVVVEVLMEPRLPMRAEFSDDELRAVSPTLAFVAEYITIATIILPSHLLLWFVLPLRAKEAEAIREAETIEADANFAERSVPEFLAQISVGSADSVLALKAEEHYVKVFTESGDQLVLQRFSAAVKAMPTEVGLQVHRSWWVAEKAVKAAKRGDRRWQLRLENELTVPISDSYVGAVRARGLLSRSPNS